jgi:purine-binding chemotaxis protein CheW
MTTVHAGLSSRAEALRHDFDHAFAAPPRMPSAADEDLLSIRVAGQPYAIRLSEIAGLFTDKRITPVPSRAPALLGIACFRGTILPVYGLHLLLGHPAAPPRWLVTAAAVSVAIAFEGFEGHLRLARDAILHQEGDGPARRLLPERALTPHGIRPIVHLPAILEAIGTHTQDAAARER